MDGRKRLQYPHRSMPPWTFLEIYYTALFPHNRVGPGIGALASDVSASRQCGVPTEPITSDSGRNCMRSRDNQRSGEELMGGEWGTSV